ncbi:Zinc transporter ZupT [Ephemeroptericola cinctiostellae]|uniref:Zinc transporter ZupT n=1 Tax=Ephemeroptericola cinctiostellae TaxID=2268024 RepID=A0A345DA85_9BURK|nr:ZIP family metal transporter [Ephemeroptericola cinctiostellae]AXF85273.1 Zinc transporter ZupT [Ephemeroptericola cinctiostellae]
MSLFLLLQIIAANLVATVLSMSLAAAAGVWLQRKVLQHLISLAAGTLLSMALLHLLPEAQEGMMAQGLDATDIFKFLLMGILGFFLLERLALFRHNHHNEHDGHDHHHGFDEDSAGHGGWMILVGSGIHNLTDGLLVAAAFLTDIKLGWATALAVALHEVMHKLGDFIVLINTGFNRQRALVYTLSSGLMAVLGGLLGYFILSDLEAWIPYVLVVSASSFLYISVADLIPQMSIFKGVREGLIQIAMLFVGVAIVWFTMQGDEHHHAHEDAHMDVHSNTAPM